MLYKHERFSLEMYELIGKDEIPVGTDMLDYYMNQKPGTWRLISVSAIDGMFDFFWSIPDEE